MNANWPNAELLDALLRGIAQMRPGERIDVTVREHEPWSVTFTTPTE